MVEFARVSIIVPVMKSIGLALKCVQYVRQNTDCPDYQIICVCGNQKACDAFEPFPTIETVQCTSENPVECLNSAAIAADGDHLVFLDPGVEVQPGWLNAILRLSREITNVGSVSPKVVGPDGLLLEAGNSIVEDETVKGIGVGSQPHLPRYNYVSQVEWGSRFCLSVRKDIFLESGLFDTRLPIPGLAFIDLSRKLRGKDRSSYYQPHSIVSFNIDLSRVFSGREALCLQGFSSENTSAMSSTEKIIRISVIIPTHNRCDLLKSSLESLINQGLKLEDYEVIVIDDGSRDNTKQICKGFSGRLPLKYFYQENAGISAAKNHGIAVATGEILLFFDDDDVADRNLLKEHIRSHESNPSENVAVLGYTTWHPSLEITKVMHFVTDIGQYLFAYNNLEDGQALDYTYFWGGRSSCKRSLLMKYGVFDNRFRFGSEDIELGYRLSKHGLKVIFNRRAMSYMMRPVTFDEFCRRCERQGTSQFHFGLLHADRAVQQWCHVDHAREKWHFAKKYLKECIRRVHKTESLLAKIQETQELINRTDQQYLKQPQDLDDTIRLVRSHAEEKNLSNYINQLRALYHIAFDASKIKGISEEMDSFYSVRKISEDSAGDITLTVNDMAYFMEKGPFVQKPTNKGNVLFIDFFLPFYDRASGSLRTFHILKALIEIGYHVTFVSRYARHAQQYVPELQELGIEVYAGDPVAARRTAGFEMSPLLDYESLLKERFFETVILSFWDNAMDYLPLIRRFSPRSKIVVDTVDVVFVRKTREAELRHDQTLLAKAQINKEKEITLYRHADRLWVVTRNDRDAICDLVDGIPIDIIPNIHAEANNQPMYERTEHILFVGNFWHPPNIDAIEYFCSQIFPLVSAELPTIQLYVVGDNVPQHLTKLSSERLVFTGYVPDLSTYLRQARVSIAPLRYGAGMKGKIGEALSWGLPVVTTSIGAEGMGLSDGYDVLIGDSPEEFAKKIITVYRDKELWSYLSFNGRNTVRKNWSPDAIKGKLEVAMEDLGSWGENQMAQPSGTVSAPGLETGLVNAFSNKSLISLVVLTFNALAYTRECVQSIENHTREPHEIIFVDNGSTDGTVKWLKQRIQRNSHYRLIENRSNLGFAKGCNQGILAAQGEYILLLNNDVVVTEGWLEGMVTCLESSDDIGIVGPMTNNISGIQKVLDIGYQSTRQLPTFAANFRSENKDRRIPARRIVGFCMLFKAKLVNIIGLLDESFGTGNFEDDDYCLRASLAGYRNLIAGDVFIHHYGSRSFIVNRIGFNSAMAGNRKIFNEKWGGLDVSSETGLRLIALNAVEQATELSHRRQLDKAIETVADAIKYAPDDKDIYYRLAEILFDAKLYGEALEALRALPRGSEDDAKYLELLGYCHEGLSTDDEAEKTADRTLYLYDTSAPALNLKGILAHKRGDKTSAEDFFRKSIAADPSYGEPYTNLGVLAWSEGHRNEALAFLEKGFILLPTSNDIVNLYHKAITDTGQFERAERHFFDAKTIYPHNQRIAFLLIDLLIQQRKHPEAMHEIQLAMLTYGIDDGILAAALEVQNKLDAREIGRKSAKKATLSLAMIVKNEKEHIAKCLWSVRPIADEMIVVDTGSIDNTKDIAKAFGAKVYDFKWNNDFSEARNYALSLAKSDWILILDADEAISARDYGALTKLISKKSSNNIAYSLTTRNYTTRLNVDNWHANDGMYAIEEAGSGWYPSKKVRLFRRDQRIRFVNPIHECLEPNIINAGIQINPCSIPIHHYGRIGNREKIQKKREAYYLLSKKKVEEKGDDQQAIYELALVAGELEKYDEASALWERFVQLDASMPSEFIHSAYINMGSVYAKLGRYQDALNASNTVLGLNPGLKEAVVNKANCMLWLDDADKVIPPLEDLLQAVPDYIPALCVLAAAYTACANSTKGRECLERLRKKGFDTASYLVDQAKILYSLKRIESAKALLESALQIRDDEEAKRLMEECCRPSDEISGNSLQS